MMLQDKAADESLKVLEDARKNAGGEAPANDRLAELGNNSHLQYV